MPFSTGSGVPVGSTEASLGAIFVAFAGSLTFKI